MTKKQVKNILVYTAFTLYSLFMLWLMFGQRLFHIINSPHSGWFNNYWRDLLGKLNLVPFHTIVEFTTSLGERWNTHAFINLAGNVVMFVPLGFLLPHVSNRTHTFGRCILISLVCLLCAEIVQLFTLLGSFDIDDLILNMIGVLVGFGLQALLGRCIKRSSRCKQ